MKLELKAFVKRSSSPVVYHGGADVPTKFLKPLTFWTEDKEAALSYAHYHGGKLHSAILEIKNPATSEVVKEIALANNLDDCGVDSECTLGFEYLSPELNGNNAFEVMKLLKESMFDGAYFDQDFSINGEIMNGGSWVAFDQNQVRCQS